MTKDLNRVHLLGHVGAEPELRYLETGTALATFSVATNRRWTDAAGQDQEETEWSRIVAWGKLAEICGQYLQKGSRVYLEGRLRTRAWEDAQTGERRSTTEVVADELIMLDGRSRTAGEHTEDDDAGGGDAGSATPSPCQSPDTAARARPRGARAAARGSDPSTSRPPL